MTDTDLLKFVEAQIRERVALEIIAWRSAQVDDGVLVDSAWGDGCRYGITAAISIARGEYDPH